MLEMKPGCERCESPIESGSVAYICSFECTFCQACSREMKGVCPNCSGELRTRPRREKTEATPEPDDHWTAVLGGSCHCGAVQFELAAVPASLTECNCSVCRRYGAQWAYYDRKTARVTFEPGAVSSYLWNDREIEFVHCNFCGCLTHYESVEKEADSRIAVNTRMLKEGEVSAIPLRYFDGAVSWKFISRDEGSPS